MSIEAKEEFRPKIVAFCCNWCSYAGADLAGSSRLSYPADVKIIRVPCSCRVNPMFILRAFQRGADGVILPRRNWLSAAGVVARASAGASELLRLYTADADEAAVCFKKAGYKIVCADKPNSTGLYETDLCRPVFLIVGGEKRGIRASVLKQADAIVRIDYGRDFPAALSAASAATIIAYEVFRQNR